MSKKEKIKRKKYIKKIKIAFNYAKYFVITTAWIMIWRWVWNLLDKYFVKEEFILSNVLSILIWVFLLLILSMSDKKASIKL